MPKRNKKKKRGAPIIKRALQYKEEGEEYARVKKMLGDGRLSAQCSDGQERVCHIRGRMRKRVWINVEDLVLVAIRDYQPDKADVLLKYTEEEDRSLQRYGELINGTGKGDQDQTEEQTTEIRFGYESSSSEDHASDNSTDLDSEDLADL